MKQFYTLFLLLAAYLTFGQSNPDKYDYFVQLNGNQLSKKVNIDEVLNHPVLTKYIDKKPDFDLRKYASIIALDQKVTIHGSFLDSVPYYQFTIPIKNKEAVRQYLIEKQGANGTNSQIQDFGKYEVFTPSGVKRSLAWNDKYLVIFELTKRLPSKYYDLADTKFEADSVAITEPYEETAVEVPAYGIPAAQNPSKKTEPIVNNDPILFEDPADTQNEYSYHGNPYEEYTVEQAEFDKKLAEKQSAILKALFENGFNAPNSAKINAQADISSWLDYGGTLTSLYEAYSAPLAIFGGYDKFLPAQKNFRKFIKGINLDFYFDNDNVKIEEILEYSQPIAEAAAKITNRKPNKNIYKYFPNQKPLGFASYHINTKAALENIPSLISDLFQSTKLLKEDITIITDLISTIVDEEATAKLFDGDLSAFLHDVKEVEVMTKKYGYDENYEETITEEKVKKTIPQFSVIFTSTHPTFGDKLLQLGVRKKVLVQKGNDYVITGVKEYGDIFIRKDNDVVIIGNTFNYFSGGSGSFVKEAKQDLRKDYMFAKLNIAQSINAFGNSGKTKPEELNKTIKISEQFADITFSSAKKLIDNKLKFELKLNSSKSDKNIILQTLDLAQELTLK